MVSSGNSAPPYPGAMSLRPVTGRSLLWIALVAVVATALGFGSTLDDYFLGDDFGFIGRYFDYPFAAWPRLFVHGWADDLWSGTYREIRPLNALAFMVDGRLWRADPLGYRLTNLLLHAACATLVGLLARRVTRGHLGCALTATALFALHPAQAGAVAWICGRVDLLATAFSVAAFLAFLGFRDAESGARGRLWLMGVCFAAVLFTKEVGFTFPALLLAADLLWLGRARRWRETRTWSPYLACVLALAPYLVCRQIAFGVAGPSGVGSGFPAVTSAAFYSELAGRQAAYLAYLFPPAQPWLRAWRDAGFAISLLHLFHLAVLVAAFGLLAFLLRRWWARPGARGGLAAVAFFGLGWYLVATVPLVVTYFSPRHLYPAVVGLALAVVLLLRGTFRSPFAFVLAALLLVGLCVQQLTKALRPWHDAARISRAVSGEIAAAALQRRPACGAVILDVPQLHGGALCWGLAVPHALRPPFFAQRLDVRFPVLETPSVYAFFYHWREQPALAAIPSIDSPVCLISVDAAGAVTSRPVSADKLRRAAIRLNAANPRVADDGTVWQRFLADLRAP